MCGIFGLIENTSVNFDDQDNIKQTYKDTIANVTNMLYKRGPNCNGNKLIIDPNFDKTVLMIHTRLKIVGDDTPQPIVSNDKTKFLIINGEIFNWRLLEKELDYTCTQSDCEIIFPLYERYKHNIPQMLNKLNGQFSFMLYDLTNKHVLIARDPIGITPLYIGYKERFYENKNNTQDKIQESTIERFVISSELKCLTMHDTSGHQYESFVDKIKTFYPRSYIYTSIDRPNNNFFDSILKYTDFYDDYSILPPTPNPQHTIRNRNIITDKIRELLTNSVRKRLVDLIRDNVEFGVLLSGGLDSSLISSLVVSIADELGYDKRIKTFSIGVKDDVPDLIAARQVVEFLNTDHKEYYFSTQTGIDNLENVIYSTESYDCTTIRASTPMYLLTKSIRQDFPNMKVLFSGELSDELLCYLYGANAPSELDFQLETLHLVSNVHMFDCLRSNKMCMSHSFEVRVPFTDIDYVKYILSLHPQWKTFGKNSTNTIEKQILRDSFIGYLPKQILYRKKEQFSDGVSSLTDSKNNWIDYIKSYSNGLYTDVDFQSKKLHYVHNRPITKEQLLYRETFCKLFNNTSYKNTSEFTVKTWEPKWSTNTDPSGRIQSFWIKN
jgi:asparagine synthase (glutamine-hydrolysing)